YCVCLWFLHSFPTRRSSDLANIISTLEIGMVLVRKAKGEELHYAVTGGLAEVVDNKLNLLVEAAELVPEIDIDRAEAAKERAEERLSSDNDQIDEERAKKALKRANNRIKLYANLSVTSS